MICRQSCDQRPNDGRYRRQSADVSLIKAHRPTFWRSSADWRPMIGRPSADIMMHFFFKTSTDCRRSSGNHRPKLHRWQIQWKSADWSTKLLTWLLQPNKKTRRPTTNSAKIGSDARFSKILLATRRPNVGDYSRKLEYKCRHKKHG